MSKPVTYTELIALKTLLSAIRKVMSCVHCPEDFGVCPGCFDALKHAHEVGKRAEGAES